MQEILLKYRTWYNGTAPKPIKLQIPGWSGESNAHANGDKPMPWHCIPFVEASTYGLELLYFFDTECHVKNIDGSIIFEGNFAEEQQKIKDVALPPFMTFAPGHFGMTSCLDIQTPEGFVLRTEPHPSFFTDETNTVPCCIPGHLQTEWWSKIFFLVFKNPYPGQTLVFKKNQPIAKILIVPKKIQYKIEKMTSEEEKNRMSMDYSIDFCTKKLAKNQWTDYLGNKFNDKYKVLSKIYAKKGLLGIENEIISIKDEINTIPGKKYKAKLFIRKKNEGIQNKKEE